MLIIINSYKYIYYKTMNFYIVLQQTLCNKCYFTTVLEF